MSAIATTSPAIGAITTLNIGVQAYVLASSSAGYVGISDQFAVLFGDDLVVTKILPRSQVHELLVDLIPVEVSTSDQPAVEAAVDGEIVIADIGTTMDGRHYQPKVEMTVIKRISEDRLLCETRTHWLLVSREGADSGAEWAAIRSVSKASATFDRAMKALV